MTLLIRDMYANRSLMRYIIMEVFSMRVYREQRDYKCKTCTRETREQAMMAPLILAYSDKQIPAR